MGNKCLSKDASQDVETCCCFGTSKKSRRKRKRKSENVLPSDLHASVEQKHTTDSSCNHALSQRPGTLEMHSPPYAEATCSPRFPDFSLHGVQRSSPGSALGTPVDLVETQGIDFKKIEKLFESYCDEINQDIILPDGVERFCLDLEVDPTEFIVLALAWKFKAATMCQFTKKEFVEGFQTVQCDSIRSLKSSFKRIESDATSDFKDLYRYTFQFALDADEGQRSLPCDIAIAMWNVVFSRNYPSFLKSWITFLKENNIRGISRDTWNMFLYLTESLQDDLSNYNDNEAWPSLFDDFVEYKRAEIENNKNIPELDALLSKEPDDDTAKSEIKIDKIASVNGVECGYIEVETNAVESKTKRNENDGDVNNAIIEKFSQLPKQSQMITALSAENGGSEKLPIPGLIPSSAESSPNSRVSTSVFPTSIQDFSENNSQHENSSPSLILSHLHSEHEDSAHTK